LDEQRAHAHEHLNLPPTPNLHPLENVASRTFATAATSPARSKPDHEKCASDAPSMHARYPRSARVTARPSGALVAIRRMRNARPLLRGGSRFNGAAPVIDRARLRRFIGWWRRTPPTLRCDLCATVLREAHRHVVDADARRLLCSCHACALRFVGGTTARFRAVPVRGRVDPASTMRSDDLEALGVPVGLAFFLSASSTGQWSAIFPSPAGVTESDLPEPVWRAFIETNDLARSVEEDIEALLVHRRPSGPTTLLVAPIDACYALTASLREAWRGLEEGAAVHDAIERAVADLVAGCDGT